MMHGPMTIMMIQSYHWFMLPVKNRQGADLNGNPSHVTVAAAAVFDALTGKNLTSVFKEFENAKAKDMLAEIKDAEYVKSRIRDFITTLIEEKEINWYFSSMNWTDANQIMQSAFERIKHYFNDERITFVFSVSLTQLQWTVRSYYGSGFDATKYLDKFFDLQISIPNADYERLPSGPNGN